jgi:hypothetical protein
MFQNRRKQATKKENLHIISIFYLILKEEEEK